MLNVSLSSENRRYQQEAINAIGHCCCVLIITSRIILLIYTWRLVLLHLAGPPFVGFGFCKAFGEHMVAHNLLATA